MTHRALAPWVAVLLLCAANGPAMAAAAPLPGHNAIASAQPLATQAGLEILRAGGNAFDAAVAVSAVLAVVEPTGSGLSGGGVYLLHRASDGSDTALDAREVAPGAATRDMFLDAKGEVIAGLSRDSALGAGIPGEPAGMAWLAAHYGRLPVAASLAPAIRLARDGFALYPRLREALQWRQALFATEPAVARRFLLHGQVPPLGTRIRQPELARTLQWLADQGLDAFYHGALADRIVAGVRAQGGIWTAADLAHYQIKERAPLVGSYRGARIVSAPPPSSGGIALIEALNILGQFDLSGADSATREQLIVEALRRVYRDRALYLGDPDFVKAPIPRLLSADYAAGLAASIRSDRATPSLALPGLSSEPPQGPQTTHFSVLDAQGNRVAATITLNFSFGSGRTIGDTGLFLNDEMDDFSVKAGVPNGYGLIGAEANEIAPGKRMLSSVTPTFVDTADRTLIIGTPGGSRIISMVLLGTLRFLDGANAQEIVSAARFHHQYLPDVLSAEAGALSAADTNALRAFGQQVEVAGRNWGNMQVVLWDRRLGAVEASADPRGDGAGIVE